MKRLIISISLLFFVTAVGSGQEINFGQYGDYSLTVDELNNDDLDFGQLISGSGNSKDIPITEAKVIEITGVEYIDVIVDVTAPTELYLNGNPGNAGDPAKAINWTLKAAYANNKGTPNVGQAKFITNISNNNFVKQFPILERQNRPPGPPPPPPTNEFEQAKVEETAYLYIYGMIPNVGNVNAGGYSCIINVTIQYD